VPHDLLKQRISQRKEQIYVEKTACIPTYNGSRICCPKDIQQTFERGSTYGLGRGFSVKSPTSLDLPPSHRKESASK